jgi:hypothetical protein
MSCPKRPTRQIERHGVVLDMQRHPAARGREQGPTLQCVSSGYMSGGCSCPEAIPASVVTSAWAAELDRSPTESGFFHVQWRGHVWLAFGLADGEIRGVYCPTHRAEREARFAGLEAQHYAPAAASA